MSETIDTTDETGAPESAPATQPENDAALAPGMEQTPAEPTTPPVEQPPRDPRDQEAIKQAAYEARRAKRREAELVERLKALEPAPDPSAPPTPADIERIVEERVQQAIQQRENTAKSEAWVAAGNAEFPDFTERCNELANMGAGENRAFMAAIGRVPDGHKVIADLAANPRDAVRVLALPPVEMAVELAVMSQRIAAAPPPPPRRASQAPPPIAPITGTARAEPDPAKMSGDEYLAFYRKQRAEKRG